MRAHIIILIAIVSFLVSCNKETIEKPGEKVEGIGFAVHFKQDAGATKGSAITNAAGVATAGGFSVWAYSYIGTWSSIPAKTGIFVGTQVTSLDGGLTWDYGTPQLWPLGERVSFFAYAPHGSATFSNFDAQGVPVINYEAPVNVTNHVDLMIAGQQLDKLGPDPVNEQFSHALSQIRFSAAKVGHTTSNVTINSIEVSSVKYSGSTPLLLPVAWTVNPTSRNYTLSIGNGLLSNTILTATTQEILASGQAMFMMPQTLDATAQITVSFSIDNLSLNWTAPLPEPVVWLPGRSYNYQLIIDGNMVMVMCAQLESPTDGTWGDY
jgi:hypothetical protein